MDEDGLQSIWEGLEVRELVGEIIVESLNLGVNVCSFSSRVSHGPGQD